MDVEPDRDGQVDRILRRSMTGGAASAATDACLDAETLAAWVEGGLGRAELAIVERHASDCARCRALAASLMRTQPAAEPSSSWWGSWQLRWLVPLAAGAAAVVLWMAVPMPDAGGGSGSLPAVGTEIARSSEQPGLPVQPEPERPAGSLESAAAAVGTDEPRQAASSPEGARVATSEPPAPEPRAEAQAQRSDRAAADAPVERDQVAVGALAKADDEVREAPGAPAPTTLPPPAAAAPSAEGVQVLRQAAAGRAPAREIVSPDPTVRWRVGPAGLIERTVDGGSTWTVQQPGGVTADLMAGSAPTASICWIVGRAGTVLVSTDGRQWRRVSFPDTADIVAVQATDERTAVVTTANGRMLRTSDAGLTWR